jgi:Family of unknown function (DUF6636)
VIRLAALLALVAAIAVPEATPAALVHFTTPSRNIGCIGNKTRLRCDIGRTSVKPPPKPLTCDFDWGNAFELLPRFAAHRLCVSDSAMGARRVLGYGKSIRIGPFLCTSRRSGLTCTSWTRHGFLLSRTRIGLY